MSFTSFNAKRQKNNSKKLYMLISLFYAMCTLLVSACGGLTEAEFHIQPGTDVYNIKRLAVLPFENFTSDNYAGEKIRRIVITELLSRGFDVVEPGEVTKLMKELKIRSLGSLAVSEIQEIGKTLKADSVMTGSVEAFGISKGISVSYPEITVNLMLIETSSGNIIWSVHNTSGGASFWTRHFGAEGISLSETARDVVEKAIDTMF
jgi:TolB-like protein